MPGDEQELTGTVQSVVFHNEENGYTIMSAKVEGQRDPVTILGTLPAVVQGEIFRASGEWVDDRKFGRQFRADRINAVAPETKDGIERFLASGLVDGIGKVYAKRIVKKFGKDTFDVIEHASQKLEKVEGIGKARRQKIKESWKQQKSVRDIMIFLHENGISTARALRIFKNYGEAAVNVLRENPYRLARDLRGVGFKTADEIAQKMGRAIDSPERLAAGIDYVLQAAADKGHCGVPRPDLIEKSAEVLGVDTELIEPVLADLVSREKLVEEPDLIFLPDLHKAEVTVAQRVREIYSQPVEYPEIEIEKAIAWFESKAGFQLGSEQKSAVAGAVSERFFVITGGPGVGKTTILNAVLKILTTKKVKPVLCAPTGRAAKRLSESTGRDASTIHRLLEYQPEAGFTKNEEDPLEGDVFVIDEASMIDIRLMAALLRAIPPEGHVILVGDVDQLPSVGPGCVLRDIIDSESVPVARLTEIFRQAEASEIVKAAHEINQGNLPKIESPNPDSDFFFIERSDPEATLSTIKQLITERMPKKFGFDPVEEIQVLAPMNVNMLGTRNLNAELQAELNPAQELKFEIERFGNTFRTGDKVIQTRNNYEHEVFNGDIGVIREITTEPVKIHVRYDANREVEYEPGELDELLLAYAITIHKSQGSEFPAVVIPISTQQFVLLQRNLIYTGITRGKRLVVLVGEKKALAMAVRNVESSARWSGLKPRLSQ
ncbi:MAG: ATP-dependent RecD-like DNA helicase [Verrucomicrobiales bacterium]|nr:ATP-dependent RecD-like DNA helicase [Verrucomicrobiales bacterium]